MASSAVVNRAKTLINTLRTNADLLAKPRVQLSLNRLKGALRSFVKFPPVTPQSMPEGGASFYAEEEPTAEVLGPGVNAQLEAKLRYFWTLAGSKPHAFMRYLQEVPDPEIKALLTNPTLARDAVTRMVRGAGIQTPEAPGDGLQAPQYQSSNVAGLAYDPKTSRLFVKFHGGSVYGYTGVPTWAFDLFQRGSASAKTKGQNQYRRFWPGKNPSIGAALHQWIKVAGYPYQRLK